MMFADVPTHGVKTLYGSLGDWFAYLCILASAAMVVAAFIRKSTRISAKG